MCLFAGIAFCMPRITKRSHGREVWEVRSGIAIAIYRWPTAFAIMEFLPHVTEFDVC